MVNFVNSWGMPLVFLVNWEQLEVSGVCYC